MKLLSLKKKSIIGRLNVMKWSCVPINDIFFCIISSTKWKHFCFLNNRLFNSIRLRVFPFFYTNMNILIFKAIHIHIIYKCTHSVQRLPWTRKAIFFFLFRENIEMRVNDTFDTVYTYTYVVFHSVGKNDFDVYQYDSQISKTVSIYIIYILYLTEEYITYTNTHTPILYIIICMIYYIFCEYESYTAIRSDGLAVGHCYLLWIREEHHFHPTTFNHICGYNIIYLQLRL